MRTFKGIPSNLHTPILGRVRLNPSIISLTRESIFVTNNPPSTLIGYTAVLSSNENPVKNLPAVTGILAADIAQLHEGDVIQLLSDGTVQILWEAHSPDNVLFTTDYCNSKCIMCPQIASEELRHHYAVSQKILALAKNTRVEHIGITGGEPTLDVNSLVSLLTTCARQFPKAMVSLLTNGKRLSDFEIARHISQSHHRMVICIPLYADNDVEHDEIVGAPGSFKETILGLYNLAKLKQPVEIRVVILKQNFERLPDLAEFIYMNLPFACHVALMGMECIGLAAENLARVWVDPDEYRAHLEKSVRILHQRAMNVSVYNLPHCLLPKPLWRFSRNSISAWKRTYLPECDGCSEKDCCAGLFGTSVLQSGNIRPI